MFWYSFVYFLLFIKSTKCNCYNEPHFESGQFHWVCSNSSIYRVPKPTLDYNRYISLYLENCRNLRLHREDFSPFKKVVAIYLSEIPMDKQRHNVSFDTFKDFILDEFYFYFLSSALDDSMVWTLPPNTYLCSFDDNNYTRVDVSSAHHLCVFLARMNKMINLPKVYNESNIEVLALPDNPLHDLTIKDLAPYCNLKEFYLIPTSDSYLITKAGKCVCEQLKTFIETFQISYAELQCVDWQNTSFWRRLMGCDLTLASIKDVRMKCGDGHILPLPAKRQYHLTVSDSLSVIFCLLFLLFLFTSMLRLVIYRNLQKKEKVVSATNNVDEELQEDE